eukprot:518705-Pelagomonas_calceolata.AAC.8
MPQVPKVASARLLGELSKVGTSPMPGLWTNIQVEILTRLTYVAVISNADNAPSTMRPKCGCQICLP